MALTRSQAKAARLVAQGRVTITFRSDDVLAGVVRGDSGTYACSIDPLGVRCACEFGQNRPGLRHSHSDALELAARPEGPRIAREWLRLVAPPR